jgi:hypothetical protein
LRTIWIAVVVDITSPGSTEIDVDNNTHVGKVRVDVAIALGVDSRYAKCRNIGLAQEDAVWNAFAREPPGLDVFRCPFGSIDSTFVVIEIASIVVGQGGHVGQR